eukprot:jgi/Antlo1/2078/2096
MQINLNSTTSEKAGSSKSENSLHNLTKRFIKLIDETPDKIIDLNTAAYLLNVGKRRIYDITNVLEGLNLLQKSHVNNVRWIGEDIKTYYSLDADNFDASCSEGLNSDNSCDAGNAGAHDQQIEADILTADRTLDVLYEEISKLSHSNRNTKNAYVTYDDLQSLDVLNNKLVFAVKTPENIKIEFADSQVPNHTELNITADGEPIDVFHVPNDR